MPAIAAMAGTTRRQLLRRRVPGRMLGRAREPPSGSVIAMSPRFFRRRTLVGDAEYLWSQVPY
jgi:hypothetical protein